MRELREKLIAFRKKFDVTQSEIADELNTTQFNISYFEKGERDLTSEQVKQLTSLMRQYEMSQTLDFKVDYLRLSFKTNDVQKIIEEVLGIQFEFFYETENRLYGYAFKYELGNIWVFNSAQGDERGVLIQMSGDGCREFEKFLQVQGRDWVAFFNKAMYYAHNVPRIDLAIDDYVEYFSIPLALKKIERGEISTRIKKIVPSYNLKLIDKEASEAIRLAEKETYRMGSEKEGMSIYFGSRNSDMHLIFYQKNYELSRKLSIPLEDIEVKNRYELRFVDDYAKTIVNVLIANPNIGEVALGILADKVVMLDRKGEKIWRNWIQLMNGVEPLRLNMSQCESTYVKLRKKENYLRNYALNGLKLFKTIDSEIGSDYFKALQTEVDLVELNDKNKHLLKLATTELRDMLVFSYQSENFQE